LRRRHGLGRGGAGGGGRIESLKIGVEEVMKKYFLKKRFLLFFAGMLALPVIFIIALAIYTYLSEPDPSWIGFLAFLGILEIISAVFMISSVNLIISESGIVYNFLFRVSVKANWAQVKTISRLRSRFGEQEYFIVEKGFIPLEWFAENWRESEIAEQISQYAPHLLLSVKQQETL
jgi:hypothetical protein